MGAVIRDPVNRAHRAPRADASGWRGRAPRCLLTGVGQHRCEGGLQTIALGDRTVPVCGLFIARLDAIVQADAARVGGARRLAAAVVLPAGAPTAADAAPGGAAPRSPARFRRNRTARPARPAGAIDRRRRIDRAAAHALAAAGASVAEIARHFGVSRMTARTAVNSPVAPVRSVTSSAEEDASLGAEPVRARCGTCRGIHCFADVETPRTCAHALEETAA